MILKDGLLLINDELVKKDILIEDGIITKIEDEIDGEDVLDCSSCFVMEGAVDVHVHLREPGFTHKETIKTGTMALAKGGITTALAMPNLKPCPDSIENLEIEEEIIRKDALINVYPYASVSKGQLGEEISDLEELTKRVYAITDDGFGVNNLEVLTKAMEIAKKNNIVMASHAEDKINPYAPEGEYVAVRREIKFAKSIGCKYHFCHMSTKESFEAILKARKEGYTNITFEVSPHHLLLNEERIKDANWKMNPPLRSEENRLATIKALLETEGVVIASDHAPHSEEEKSREYNKCPNGILGAETMLPLIYTNFVATGLATHKDFLNWLVYNPIKIFNLPKKKIAVGEVADITVLDIKNKRKYLKEEILSIGKNSPYIGMELLGFPRYTILNDKLIWRAK